MTLAVPRSGRAALVLAIGDGVGVLLAFWSAYLIRFTGQVPDRNWESFLQAAPWLVLGALVLLYGLGLYRQGPIERREEFVGIIVFSGLFTVVGMGISYAGATYAVPRTVFLINAPLQALILLGVHWIVGEVEFRWSGPSRVLVVGQGQAVARVAERLRTSAGSRWEFASLDVGDDWTGGDEWRACLASWTAVYLDETLSFDTQREIAALVMESGRTLLVPPTAEGLLMYGLGEFTYLGDQLLLVARTPYMRSDVQTVKRLIDLVGATVFGLLSSPLWIAAALAIWLTSPGPVLFRQTRLGLHGKPFTLLKFRTMVDGAEDQTGPVIASRSDERITRVGRILRAIRLDEVPQVLNVLRGEMSLVGPRPERPEFVEVFQKRHPYYRLRHLVKPGITGLAQVVGTYGTRVADKLRFDLLYVRKLSVLMDLQILLWTLKVVLLPERAQGLQEPLEDLIGLELEVAVGVDNDRTETGARASGPDSARALTLRLRADDRRGL